MSTNQKVEWSNADIEHLLFKWDSTRGVQLKVEDAVMFLKMKHTLQGIDLSNDLTTIIAYTDGLIAWFANPADDNEKCPYAEDHYLYGVWHAAHVAWTQQTHIIFVKFVGAYDSFTKLVPSNAVPKTSPR